MMQPTADISDDAEDDILTIQPTNATNNDSDEHKHQHNW